MKKLLVLMVVLALSVMANATVISWSVDSVDVAVGETVTVQLIASDNAFYDDVWVGQDIGTIAQIISITEIANNAGDNGYAADQTSNEWPGWYVVGAADMSEPFTSVIAGAQWDVVIKGLAVGTTEMDSDDSEVGGLNDILTVNVPEPATIALLCLGGLLIRKK